MVFMDYKLYLPMLTSDGYTSFFLVTFDGTDLSVVHVGTTDCTTGTTAAFDYMGIFYTCTGQSGYNLFYIDFDTY